MAASNTPRTRSTAAKKPTPKVPQDRKRPAAVIAEEDRPQGHDLLRPVALLRSSEQATLNADLMALFEEMGVDMGAVSKAGAAAAADEDVDDLEAEHAEDADGVEKPSAEDAALQEIEVNSDAIRAIGKMSVTLETFVVAGREHDFIQLDTGKGALNRITNLGMWYLEQLGE